MQNFFRYSGGEGGGSSSSSYGDLFSEELDGLRVLDGCSYKEEKNMITLYNNRSKEPIPSGSYSEETISHTARLDIGLFGDGGDARLSELLNPEDRRELAQHHAIYDRMRVTFKGGEYAVMKCRKLCKMVSSYVPEPDSSAWKGPEILDIMRKVAYDIWDRSRKSGNVKSNPKSLSASNPDRSRAAEPAAVEASSGASDTVYKPSGVTVKEKLEENQMLVQYYG